MSDGTPAALAPPAAKCCGKCAFRRGSPERSDPYGWMRLVESMSEDGVPFACHESVPGHPQEERDGTPRWRTCRGYAATKHVEPGRLMALALVEPDETAARS